MHAVGNRSLRPRAREPRSYLRARDFKQAPTQSSSRYESRTLTLDHVAIPQPAEMVVCFQFPSGIRVIGKTPSFAVRAACDIPRESRKIPSRSWKVSFVDSAQLNKVSIFNLHLQGHVRRFTEQVRIGE